MSGGRCLLWQRPVRLSHPADCPKSNAGSGLSYVSCALFTFTHPHLFGSICHYSPFPQTTFLSSSRHRKSICCSPTCGMWWSIKMNVHMETGLITQLLSSRRSTWVSHFAHPHPYRLSHSTYWQHRTPWEGLPLCLHSVWQNGLPTVASLPYLCSIHRNYRAWSRKKSQRTLKFLQVNSHTNINEVINVCKECDN